MSTISTHILDTSRGGPANGVHVRLDFQNLDESWSQLAEAWTDEDTARLEAYLAARAGLRDTDARLGEVLGGFQELVQADRSGRLAELTARAA